MPGAHAEGGRGLCAPTGQCAPDINPSSSASISYWLAGLQLLNLEYQEIALLSKSSMLNQQPAIYELRITTLNIGSWSGHSLEVDDKMVSWRVWTSSVSRR